MATINVYAAWIGILLGLVAGAIQGLFFHNEDWLQGYSSWPRRMIRLGHISFFGIAFINLAFAVTALYVDAGFFRASPAAVWSSRLLIIGAITMPLICYLSAIKKPVRHLFFIPVSCLLTAVGTLIVGVMFS